jgi:hypothetical protein
MSTHCLVRRERDHHGDPCAKQEQGGSGRMRHLHQLCGGDEFADIPKDNGRREREEIDYHGSNEHNTCDDPVQRAVAHADL